MHFGDSDVQLEQPDHEEKVAAVFRAANRLRMAILVHLRASVSNKRPYGRTQALLFLDRLLPLASDVTVQIAHMAGTGPGYHDAEADEAMGVLAEAVQRGDRRTARLWFDAATCADKAITPDDARQLVHRIRQVGANRVLFGSDAAAPGNLLPADAWGVFSLLPLTPAEQQQIAGNRAPYMR